MQPQTLRFQVKEITAPVLVETVENVLPRIFPTLSASLPGG